MGHFVDNGCEGAAHEEGHDFGLSDGSDMSSIGFAQAVASARRAAELSAMLMPAAVMGAGCVVLDGLVECQKRTWTRVTSSSPSIDGGGLRDRLAFLLERLQGATSDNTPRGTSSWVAWCLATVVVKRLRRAGPLPALLAQWVAICRPDLALTTPDVARLVALLRDQEHSGAIARPSGPPRDKKALAQIETQLCQAFGRRWRSVLKLDSIPIGGDCVSEAFRAVVREERLDAAQAQLPSCADLPPPHGNRSSKITHSVEDKQRTRSALRFSFPRTRLLPVGLPTSAVAFCRRWGSWCHDKFSGDTEDVEENLAEATDARSVVLRVRRHDVAELAHTDLVLIRFVMRALSFLNLVDQDASHILDDFASFVAEQLDLRYEARLLRITRDAMSTGSGVTLPRPMGRTTAEVFMVSLEEGVCLADVLRRPYVRLADESDAAMRALTARRLAVAFWKVVFENGLALGGLIPNSVLLRSICDINEPCPEPQDEDREEEQDMQEVVMLRSGFNCEVGDKIRSDLVAFAAILFEGNVERLGSFILSRVLLWTDKAEDPAGFSASAAKLAIRAIGQRACGSGGSQQPIRGALLLKRALGLCEAHKVPISTPHLRLAAAVASVHGVCARLDPATAGNLFGALQVVAEDHWTG